MCGIFGLLANSQSGLINNSVKSILNQLLILSESRGKEAAGLAILNNNVIKVYKQAISPSEMVKSKEYLKLVDEISKEEHVAIIGHSRLVTNGAQNTRANNQPVIAGDMAGVHNGIIVNVQKLWEKYTELKRNCDVDTEIIFQLIRYFSKQNNSLVKGVQVAYGQIYGVANIAVFLKDYNQLLLATNNGSIYFCVNEEKNAVIFLSEEYLLKTLIKNQKLDNFKITHLKPGHGMLIDLNDISIQQFELSVGSSPLVEKNNANYTIEEITGLDNQISTLANVLDKTAPKWMMEEYERNKAAISKLRRCKKCVLPETVPFIDIDENGLCIDCRRHDEKSKQNYLGHDALAQMVKQYRRSDGGPDCLIPISGGRDSCYTLHYFKKILKMNPLAYTYDWGMVTDLARRNISRMCSKLGVEHILVSADIIKKRKFIRQNVEAWLKKPDLGIIPLFMAGDKHFFYHAAQLREHSGIKLIVFAMNSLENTDFKSGFCGINRGVGKGRKGGADTQGSNGNLQMVAYYLKSFLKNPGYFNSSLLDTFTAYFIYYMSPIHKEYVIFEDYIKWDEDTIVNTLINEYDWEISPDTTTTWRIGDGTVPFYNYIYYTVAGFTENETFRSNQIREGMITREQALKFIEDESIPRYESFAWYCNTIGVDPEKCLKVIHAIPKLYKI